LNGFGIAYLPEDGVRANLEAGKLIRVLADWCDPFTVYHLYFPSRREPPPALAVLVEALRYEI
jgi:DNA-binding transcriptional LysR family regulator